MAISRKDALKRLNGLAPGIEKHLRFISLNPDSSALPHWKGECEGWLTQMEAMLRHVGKKTAGEWKTRIETWRAALGP